MGAAFPNLKSYSDVGQEEKRCIPGSVERLFVSFLGPVTFHGTISGFSGGYRFGPA